MEFTKGKIQRKKKSLTHLVYQFRSSDSNYTGREALVLGLLSEALSKCFLWNDPIVLTETACSK